MKMREVRVKGVNELEGIRLDFVMGDVEVTVRQVKDEPPAVTLRKRPELGDRWGAEHFLTDLETLEAIARLARHKWRGRGK